MSKTSRASGSAENRQRPDGGYRRALALRWTRRDRLAILVVATAVAFLAGCVLLALAASASTVTLAEPLASPGTATVIENQDESPSDALVLPIAEVTLEDGTAGVVVGLPDEGDPAFDSDRHASDSVRHASDSDRREFDLEPPPTDGLERGDLTAQRTDRLEGSAGTFTTTVHPRTAADVLSPWWYVGDRETVEELGPTGAIAITPATGSVPETGTPLRSVLPFFAGGQADLVAALSIVALASGALVGVTVHSVVRIGVRERRRTIRIARATGARPRDVLVPFAVRGGLLSAVGVALGVAVGVIVPNLAVNLAIYAGLPTSISVGVDRHALALLGSTSIAIVALGTAAGALAAWPAATGSPAAIGRDEREAGRGLSVLAWGTVVPAVATLAVFAGCVLLAVALVATATPVATAPGVTLVEPGSPHPVASTVPEAYADAIAAQGGAVSPEILGFGVVDGQPFLVRGATYEAFETVTDAELIAGRDPVGPDEAVIGASLARTLDVDVGETMLLGGSTHAAIARVEVVGVYDAPGAHADQLVVPLATARHLAGYGADEVGFVRTNATFTTSSTSGVTVVDVDAPARVPANATVEPTVTLWNVADEDRREEVTATLGDERTAETVTLAPGERKSVSLSLPTRSPGEETLEVANRSYDLTVLEPDTPHVRGLPREIPPESEPRFRVVDALGDPIANTTVTIEESTDESVDGDEETDADPSRTTDANQSRTTDANQSRTTDANQSRTTDDGGWVRLPPVAAGNYSVTVEADGHVASRSVTVTEAAERGLSATVSIHPEHPTTVTVPSARMKLVNPWNESRETSVLVVGPGGEREHPVRVEPGEERMIEVALERMPPGTYDVTVETDGGVVETSYAVSGDDRLGAALASGGYDVGESPLGRAIESAIGNATLLVATLVGLAALTTIGGLSAALARAVLSRRRTIGVYRATGASPLRIYRLVLRDALLLGSVATTLAIVLAVVALVAFSRLGLLSVYGISVTPVAPLTVVLIVVGAGIGLTFLAAGVATAALVRSTPSSLLSRMG